MDVIKRTITLKLTLLISASFFILSSCTDPGDGYKTPVTTSDIPTTSYKKVISGLQHTCAINTNDQLKCWGTNYYGQLGDGTTIDKATSTLIDSGVTYSKVAVGEEHTCGITSAGVLKCWGRNNFGQLGNGSNVNSSTPVVINSGVTYIDVSVSGNQSCAVTNANVAQCWGYNGFGGLGDGTTTNKNIPTAVNDPGINYKSIAVGSLYACGITTTDVVRCWGNNDFGQLGNGQMGNKSTPVAITDNTTYKYIAASDINSSYTCGLTTANDLKCWGSNMYGQFGNGTQTDSQTAVAISGKKFSSISVGYVHTCGVEQTTQILYCWGKNDFGQLADYTVTDRLSFTHSDTGVTYSDVSTGYNYTCAINTDSKMRCWGLNSGGQLGKGDYIDRPYPSYVQ